MHALAIRIGRTLTRAALLGALAIGGARAEQHNPAVGPLGERELTVVNHGVRTISEIYVAPTVADDWGDQLLGDGAVGPGRQHRLRLGRMRDCSFDVRVVYDDASREERLGVDVCHARQVVFDGSTASAPETASGEAHRVTVVDRAPLPLQQLFISPADAPQWGDDLLPGGTISAGSGVAITYHGPCVVDVRVVFDNRSAEERRGLDLCAQPALSVQPGWTTAETAPAPADSGIVLVNRSGHPVTGLRVVPAGAPPGGPDLLGRLVVSDGTEAKVAFSRGGNCRFDVTANLFDAADRRISGIDLCGSPQGLLSP